MNRFYLDQLDTLGGNLETLAAQGQKTILFGVSFALLDLIEGYPTPDIAFIGFFMLDVTRQGQGLGSDMVEELCRALADMGFSAVRLGWVRGNEQATHFWHKNGFVETGATNVTDAYTVVVAERPLYRA